MYELTMILNQTWTTCTMWFSRRFTW